MANDRGYVRMYRSVLDNPTFQNHFEAMAFIYLVANAAWCPMKVRYKGQLITLERGQVAISVRDFAAKMGKDKGWAQRFLVRLAEQDMVRTATETGVNVITLCNYSKYQQSGETTETVTRQQSGQERGRSGTQKEEGKQGKEEKTPYSPPARKRFTAWPEGQEVPVDWLRWAMSDKGWTSQQAKTEAQRFLDYAMANGKTYADWKAAWRQWCRNAFQKTVGAAQQPLSL